MEISSLLHDLCLFSSSSEKPRPCPPLPPITELLSLLQKKLIGAADKPSESRALIGQVAQLFKAADPDWLFSLAPNDQNSGWEELQVAYSSVTSALIGCAALPLCEDDSSSLSTEAYRSVPSQAAAVSSALTALLENWDKGGGARGKLTKLVFIVAPPICVFSIIHFQVRQQTSCDAVSWSRCWCWQLVKLSQSDFRLKDQTDIIVCFCCRIRCGPVPPPGQQLGAFMRRCWGLAAGQTPPTSWWGTEGFWEESWTSCSLSSPSETLSSLLVLKNLRLGNAF